MCQYVTELSQAFLIYNKLNLKTCYSSNACKVIKIVPFSHRNPKHESVIINYTAFVSSLSFSTQLLSTLNVHYTAGIINVVPDNEHVYYNTLLIYKSSQNLKITHNHNVFVVIQIYRKQLLG